MSPGVAGKISRCSFSRALARQTILIIMKCATDVTYRPIVFLVNVQAADLISGLHFFLRQWIVQKKVLLFVAYKWAVKRRLKRFGGRMGTAWCTRRKIIAKGIWKGVDISSRRYYCPRVLTYCTRNWISLSFWIPHTWWRRCWARPRSGLSLRTERYIRLVRIQQINCRS